MVSEAVPRFRYLKDLGSGAFGFVILAEDTHTRELVAVKKLPRSMAADLSMERELLAHSRLRHPHVVRFHQVFLSPHHANLVLEYVPDGTLLQHVQQHKILPESQARWLFQQLVLAVDYCHNMGVSNRDIKLDNVLLDKSTRGRPDWPILKLTDYGYARTVSSTSEASSKVGTLSYMAPEVLQSNKYSAKRADVWSCGVVLYAMLCGYMPFAATDDQPLRERLEKLAGDMQQRRYKMPERLSAGAKDLLGQLLQPDPKARITVAGILAHPWFTVGLPKEALTMNANFLQLPRACSQSESDIKRLVRKAREHAVYRDLKDSQSEGLYPLAQYQVTASAAT